MDDVIVTLYEKPTGPRPFVRGNANADPGGAGDAIDIADAISILFSLFLGDPVPPCLDAADANGDSKLDIADVIYVLDFLFLGGPAPPAPFPACGSNPWWVESLGCEAFPPCGSHL